MTPRAPHIAVASPLGGTGCTTVAAHLAVVLSRLGHPCVAVELAPHNVLGQHFGATTPPEHGWMRRSLQDGWWGDAALESSLNVRLLPSGPVTPVEWSRLCEHLSAHPLWLSEQLTALELSPSTLVLSDAGAWPQPLAHQAVGDADLLVVTLETSPRACAAAAAVTTLLDAARPDADRAIVLTRFDPRRPSHRDALVWMQQRWGDLVVPYSVHEDDHIPRAFAGASCVCIEAPHAQSSHDLEGVAHWLLQRLGLPTPAEIV